MTTPIPTMSDQQRQEEAKRKVRQAKENAVAFARLGDIGKAAVYWRIAKDARAAGLPGEE